MELVWEALFEADTIFLKVTKFWELMSDLEIRDSPQNAAN